MIRKLRGLIGHLDCKDIDKARLSGLSVDVELLAYP